MGRIDLFQSAVFSVQRCNLNLRARSPRALTAASFRIPLVDERTRINCLLRSRDKRNSTDLTPGSFRKAARTRARQFPQVTPVITAR